LSIPGSVPRLRHRRALRASALLLVCAVIPAVALSGTFGYYLTATQRSALDEGIKDKAERLSLALSKDLATQVQLLTILSESPRLDPPLETEEFSQLGERLRQRVPSWQMLRITAPDGSIVLTLPSVDQDQRLKRVVDEQSHATMVRTAEPVIGNLLFGPRRLPEFPVRVPVLRDGKVVYGLTSSIRPDALGQVFVDNGLPSHWVGWIGDGAGRLVYANFVDVNDLTRPISQVVSTEPPGGTLASGRLVDGRAVRISSVPVEGTDWTMNVAMPSDAYAAAYGSGLAVIAVSALTTVALSIVAALLFLRELAARRRDEETVASWQRLDALGKLAGGVAHDLNNLLMVFQSAADRLAHRPEDSRRTALIADNLRQAVTRGKSLTQRLLSFSRRSNTDAVSVRLNEHVDALRDTLVQTGQELVSLTFDDAPDLWPVRIDLPSLETALINLATNAREAMPQGGRVSVSIRNVDDLSSAGGDSRSPGIALSVSDEGNGILPEDIHRVLEPFYTTKENASGLGLSQVAAFAKRSGGTLKVGSVPGRGSVFTILLPCDPAAQTEVRPAIAPRRLPASILVVDDTAASREAACQVLVDAGVVTVEATDGRSALDILESRVVGGVLSDIRMPGMSGLDLLEHVRQKYPGLPIVLMTGFSEVIEQGHRVDAPVLMKPFTFEQLCHAFSAAQSAQGTANVVALRRT
jgi:signal transduction histidine kinase/ActR/RegA family two-component response regulator